MADKRLAAVGGLIFCGLVLLLLLILYFPDTGDNRDDQVVTIKSWEGMKSDTTEVPETESKIMVAARIIEDMGVTFLVLLAVVTAASGLACLTWACCCLS